MSISSDKITYLLYKTDKNQLPIIVNRLVEDNEQLDITLIGNRVKEYGESFHNNLLSLLENFSCPALNPLDPITKQTPDTDNTTDNRLSKPTEGQLWHNNSVNKIYVYEITNVFDNIGKWTPLTGLDEVAGNYGQLESGQSIPQPEFNGYVFPYEECSWVVSPFNYLSEIEEMECGTNETLDGDTITNVEVYCRVKHLGQSTWTYYPVNYQIMGIRENSST